MGIRDFLKRRREERNSKKEIVSEGGMSIDVGKVITPTTSPTYKEITSTKTSSGSSSKPSTKPTVEYVDLYAPIESFDVSTGKDGTTFRKKPGTPTYTRDSTSATPTYTQVRIEKKPSLIQQAIIQQTQSDLRKAQEQRIRQDQTIYLRESGGVTKGGTKYTGEAIVPGTEGKTANQIRKELAMEYKEQTGEYVSPTRLRGKVEYEEVLVKDEPGEQLYWEKAPTEKERFISSIEEKGGLISGTISYLSGFTERKILEIQFKRAERNKNYELYQPFATARGAGIIVESAPYFTPVGAEILVLSGAEQLFSPLGYRARKEEIKMYEFEGKTKTGAIVRAVGVPLFEIGLGVVGVRAKIKGNDLLKLKEESPEVFLGVTKDIKGGTESLIGLRRKSGKIVSETQVRFEAIKTGEKTAQIQKGIAEQVITRPALKVNLAKNKLGQVEKLRISNFERIKSRFSFTGEAQQVTARYIQIDKINKNLKVIRDIEKPTTATYSEINLLGQDLTKIKSRGISLGKTEGEFTYIVSGKASPQYRFREKPFDLVSNWKSRVVEFDSIGAIKKIGKPRVQGFDLGKSSQVQINLGDDALKQALQVEEEILGLKVQTRKGINKISTTGAFELKPTITETKTLEVKELKPVLEIKNIELQEKEISTKTIQVEKLKQKTKSAKKIESLPVLDLAQSFTQEKTNRMTKLFKQAQSLRSQKKQESFNVNLKLKTPKLTSKFTPGIKVPIKLKESFVERLSKKTDEEFNVFVKDIGLIAKTKSKKEAKDVLEDYLGKSLKASGFITKGGQRLKAEELGLSFGFRAGKSDPFKIVEKKEKRLRRGTTGKEIQFFR